MPTFRCFKCGQQKRNGLDLCHCPQKEPATRDEVLARIFFINERARTSFALGDRVMNLFAKEQRGEIVGAGDLRLLVKFDGSADPILCHPKDIQTIPKPIERSQPRRQT